MLPAAVDALVTLADSGMIVEFTAAAEKMFGYRRDQVLGSALFGARLPKPEKDA